MIIIINIYFILHTKQGILNTYRKTHFLNKQFSDLQLLSILLLRRLKKQCINLLFFSHPVMYIFMLISHSTHVHLNLSWTHLCGPSSSCPARFTNYTGRGHYSWPCSTGRASWCNGVWRGLTLGCFWLNWQSLKRPFWSINN